MAGNGPPPKPRDQRARTNAEPIPTTVIRREVAAQPDLPAGEWPTRTREWWATWGASPQAEHFTATDWEVLLECALLHAKFWATGSASIAAELRLRVAKFGATPEDRARLRMQFAPETASDSGRSTNAKIVSLNDRRERLTAGGP